MFLRIKKEKKTKGMRLLGRNGEGRIGGGGWGRRRLDSGHHSALGTRSATAMASPTQKHVFLF